MGKGTPIGGGGAPCVRVLCSAVVLFIALAAEPARAGSRAAPPGEVPAEARAPLSAALGRALPEFHLAPRADGLRAGNSAGFTADFSSSGLTVRRGGSRWELHLSGFGRGGGLTPAAPVAPAEADENRVEYRRPGLTEWYVNGPLGLEQGFDLAAPPSGSGPLTLALSSSGDLAAQLDSDQALTLRDARGTAVLRYSGLVAEDANGRRLGARLRLGGGKVLLEIDDAGARYPLHIDPFVQVAKLTASDGATGNEFGESVSISGDVAVVGAPVKKEAYVFVKPSTGWADATETAILTGSDSPPSFGEAVAISGDTIVVGAPRQTVGTNTQQGAAYVFVKPGTGWVTATQTAVLTTSDASQAFANFGSAVAISGDTILVGAHFAFVAPASNEQGAAYLFVKPGSGWTTMTQTARLTGSDSAATDQFGISVAIDGDTAVVGTPRKTVGTTVQQGEAYVFVKPSTGWVNTTEAAILTASDGKAGDGLGTSVGVSGGTVVAAATFATGPLGPSQGAAYVFLEPTAGWATESETAKLTPSDAVSADFGQSVSIDGDTVVVGAPDALATGTTFSGAAYVFVKPSTGWATGTETQKLLPSDPKDGESFGGGDAGEPNGVFISGNTIIAGAFAADGANDSQGAAYVFQTTANTGTAQITVRKQYSDGNTAAVNVTMSCTNGVTPDSATKPASPATPAVFNLSNVPSDGNARCTATEQVPAGYTADQSECASITLAQPPGIGCTIVNTANTGGGTLEVNKQYSDGNTTPVDVTVSCTNGATPDAPTKPASPGAPATFTISHIPANGDATCTATEKTPAGYTADQSQCASISLAAVDVWSCTITNTPTADTTPPCLDVEKVIAPRRGFYPGETEKHFPAKVGSQPVTLEGTVTDDSGVASVTVDGVPARLHGKHWRLEHLPLHPGPNHLTVVATDTSGNSARQTVVVFFDPDLDHDGIPNEIDGNCRGKPEYRNPWNFSFSDKTLPDGTTCGRFDPEGHRVRFEAETPDTIGPIGVRVSVTGPGHHDAHFRLDQKAERIELPDGRYTLSDRGPTSAVTIEEGGPVEIEGSLEGERFELRVGDGGSAAWTELYRHHRAGLQLQALASPVSLNGVWLRPGREVTLGELDADLDLGRDRVDLEATFEPGEGNNGLSPATEALTLRVGSDELDLPPGSLHPAGANRWRFEDDRGGIHLALTLRKVSRWGHTRYVLDVDVRGFRLSGGQHPVVLMIGDDAGVDD